MRYITCSVASALVLWMLLPGGSHGESLNRGTPYLYHPSRTFLAGFFLGHTCGYALLCQDISIVSPD